MTDFPKLPVATGTHAAEWKLRGHALPGELIAEPSRPPALELYGDMTDVDWTGGREFPEVHEHPRLAGTLRSNQDVVLTDLRIARLREKLAAIHAEEESRASIAEAAKAQLRDPNEHYCA